MKKESDRMENKIPGGNGKDKIAVPRAPTRGHWIASGSKERCEMERMLACNEQLQCHGLFLNGEQCAALTQHRREALQARGRMEFGQSVLPKLIEAFCDSPYLDQSNLEQTLAELIDMFYYFKGESMERLSDDDLIDHMKRAFDKVCQGSLEALAGRSLEELCKQAREGGGMPW